MEKKTIQPKFKVWVVFGDRVKFGDGRAQLLELIDRLGSIQKAVAEFGMSYRNAWGYLRDLENAAGFPLLQRGPGGGPASGTRLTRQGRSSSPATGDTGVVWRTTSTGSSRGRSSRSDFIFAIDYAIESIYTFSPSVLTSTESRFSSPAPMSGGRSIRGDADEASCSRLLRIESFHRGQGDTHKEDEMELFRGRISSRVWVLTATLVLAWIGGGLLGAVPAQAGQAVILSTTTSTQDSGLLDVLVPLFEKQTGLP